MKHDYKQALEKIKEGMVTIHTHDDEFTENGNKAYCAIRSALELAIALQPKPISDAPRDGTPILAYIAKSGENK